MTTTREVRDEILDGLAPEDPRARRSRSDLRRINALMGNARTVARLLGSGRPGTILEIGAGDGAFARRVARRLGDPLHLGGDASGKDRRLCVASLGGPSHGLPRRSAEPPFRSSMEDPLPHGSPFRSSRGTISKCLTLLDRQPPTECAATGSRKAEWNFRVVVADAFKFLKEPEGERFDAIFANLFLHHFEDERLRELLALAAARTDLFVACEPRRSALALAGTRALGAIGCNDVTRHDARVSVLAGFRDRDLSILWPADGWRVEERTAPPFGHAFRAERIR